MTGRPLLGEGFVDGALHGEARVLEHEPLTILTPEQQWAYAASGSLDQAFRGDDGSLLGPVRLVIDITVVTGAAGIGVTSPDGTVFLREAQASEGSVRITIPFSAGEQLGRLVLRNTRSGGASKFILHRARVVHVAAGERSYPVDVAARSLAMEGPPPDGATQIVFDTEAARAINAARIEWLERSRLPLENARVLDAGCGIGHFIPFYRARGCRVTALDGRAENIAELRRRFPAVEAHVGDVQTLDPRAYGRFDVVHCFGLLYHVESPWSALRNLGDMCDSVLIVETMVLDSSRPLLALADETRSASQALAGVGCRPAPAFIALALNRIGFKYVYGASVPPRHPDFEFDWLDNLDVMRNGRSLRCVFVASRIPLDEAPLVALL